MFAIIAIILVSLALFTTFYTKRLTLERGVIYPPYATVLKAYTYNGSIYVTIGVFNETYPISILGGYVKIINTQQETNITPTTSKVFNVTFPITPALAAFSSITVQGVIKGTMKGNPIYITFSELVHLNISTEVSVVRFTYMDSEANITLYISNPLNITILSINNIALANANTSTLVATIGKQILNLSLPQGVHYITITINFTKGEIFQKEVIYNSYYYLTGYLVAKVYYIPPLNQTFYLYKLERLV